MWPCDPSPPPPPGLGAVPLNPTPWPKMGTPPQALRGVPTGSEGPLVQELKGFGWRCVAVVCLGGGGMLRVCDLGSGFGVMGVRSGGLAAVGRDLGFRCLGVSGFGVGV